MTETTDFALCRDRLDDLAVRAVGTCSSVARAFLGQGPGLDDPSVTRKLEELPGLRWQLEDIAPVPAPLQGCADLLNRALLLIEDGTAALGAFDLPRGAALFAEATELLADRYAREMRRAQRA